MKHPHIAIAGAHTVGGISANVIAGAGSQAFELADKTSRACTFCGYAVGYRGIFSGTPADASGAYRVSTVKAYFSSAKGCVQSDFAHFGSAQYGNGIFGFKIYNLTIGRTNTVGGISAHVIAAARNQSINLCDKTACTGTCRTQAVTGSGRLLRTPANPFVQDGIAAIGRDFASANYRCCCNQAKFAGTHFRNYSIQGFEGLQGPVAGAKVVEGIRSHVIGSSGI